MSEYPVQEGRANGVRCDKYECDNEISNPRWSSTRMRDYAAQHGWTCVDELDYCPDHSEPESVYELAEYPDYPEGGATETAMVHVQEKLAGEVAISGGLKCPACDDVGWYPHDDQQVQCEFCYTVPDSIFNRMAENRKAHDPNMDCTAEREALSDEH